MADAKICAVDGCGKRVLARGWCSNHYARWRRNGDPLLDIAKRGQGLQWLREHVEYRGEQCLVWPFGKSTSGRGMLKISGQMHNAARLMCEWAWGEPPTEFHQCAHNCGNPSCVAPGHLRWATPKENTADKIVHGTEQRGEKSGVAKLNEEQVRRIRELRGKITQRELAQIYGVSVANIQAVHLRKTWTHLDG